MNRSPIRWAALACAAAALALSSAGASAQSITLNDPNCSDFTLGGTPGNRTLTCVVSSAPTCTVTGPTTGTLTSPITLTASCSPAATSWAWTSDFVGSPTCNGATTQSCQDTQSLAGTVNYKVTGTNGQGAGPQSPAHAVVWSNTVAAPSGCSVNFPSGTQTPPYSYNLTVTCGGGAATSWQWSVGSTATTQTITGNISSTTTFKVIASNSGGAAPQVSGTITVGTGGGGGNIDCSAQGFAATHVFNIVWGSTAQTTTAANGGFGPLDALVMKFTAPANGGTLTKMATMSGAEYGDAPNARFGTVSTLPCDFGGASALPIFGGGQQIFCLASQTACSNSTSFSAAFLNTRIGSAQLTPGVTYYVNVGNQAGSCAVNGSCNMIFNWGWPTR